MSSTTDVEQGNLVEAADVVEQVVEQDIDLPDDRHPVRYPAGVLAHGLHAIAHHVATYRLEYIRVESYPDVIDDRPVIEVHVDRFTIGSWLDTVHLDVEHRDVTPPLDGVELQAVQYRRFVRLPDSGVRVSLLSIEFEQVPA